MSVADKLDQASGAFFALGLLSSKFRYLPLSYLSALGNLLSLAFYLFAYLFWAIASHLQPVAQRIEEKTPINPLVKIWSDFLPFRSQFLLAASIGVVAVFVSLASLLYPALFLPSTWLFVLSNVIWSMGQKLKVHYLQECADESFKKEDCYLSYALWGTVLSLVNAIYATLLLTLPLPAVIVVILTASQVFSVGMTFRFWYLHLYWPEPKPKPDSPREGKNVQASAATSEPCLDLSKSLSPNSQSDEIKHYPPLFLPPTPAPKSKDEGQELGVSPR